MGSDRPALSYIDIHMCFDPDYRDDDARWRFWNTAPPDPIAAARADGRAHYNRVLHTVLMPDSFMPLGAHRDKTMRRVPVDYFRWLLAQDWFENSPQWAPVRDYLQRFPIDPPSPHCPPIAHHAPEA